jgi:hypothetical protein
MTAPDAEIIAAADDPVESVNGYGAVAPEGPAAERPELLLGAAFAGGFLLARILRRRAS